MRAKWQAMESSRPRNRLSLAALVVLAAIIVVNTLATSSVIPRTPMSDIPDDNRPPANPKPAWSPSTYLAQWGGFALSSPFGVAVNATGYVYVLDYSNHRMVVFTPAGQFLFKWGRNGGDGSSGAGNGEFFNPMGVAVNATGHVYVADMSNHRVQVFTQTGQFLAKWNKTDGGAGSGDGEFSGPQAVAVNATGHVYVAEQFNQRVQVFTQTGQFVTKWGSGGAGDGDFNNPWGIAVNATGHVYVADQTNHRVQVFTQSGQFVTKWGRNGGDGTSGSSEREFNNPRGIAVNATGHVYVADTTNNRVQVFGNQFPAANNVAINPSSPLTSDDLQLGYTFSDPDGDPAQVPRVRWYKNNSLQAQFNDIFTVPATWTLVTDLWNASVEAFDGTNYGAPVWSQTVTIGNTAPASVADLVAAPQNDTTILLTWTAPGEDGMAGNASGYLLKYALATIASEANFNAATTWPTGTPRGNGTLETYNVTGLAGDTTYFFALKAYDEILVNTSISNVASAKTNDTTAPGVITDLSVIATTTTTITLNWTAPGDNGGSGTVAGYLLHYATTPITDEASFDAATNYTHAWVGFVVVGSTEARVVSGLAPDVTYYFALKAFDEVPLNSSVSNCASNHTTDLVAPGQVTDLAVIATTTTTITLNWTAPGDNGGSGTIAGYLLHYSTTAITDEASFNAATNYMHAWGGFVAGGSTEARVVSGLSSDMTFYFALKAFDEVPYNSSVSNCASNHTVDVVAPGAVIDLEMTPTVDGFALTWTALGDNGISGNVSGYVLKYSTTPITAGTFDAATTYSTAGWTNLASNGTREAQNVTGLALHTKYYFALKARDETGNNASISNVASGTTTSGDTDTDGMPDTWELANSFDPWDPADSLTDADEDGLVNVIEYQRGTNPRLADTDGDNLLDGAEVNTYHTNPLLADTDGDGFSDGAEVSAGTDPLNAADNPQTRANMQLLIIVASIGVCAVIAGVFIAKKATSNQVARAIKDMETQMKNDEPENLARVTHDSERLVSKAGRAQGPVLIATREKAIQWMNQRNLIMGEVAGARAQVQQGQWAAVYSLFRALDELLRQGTPKQVTEWNIIRAEVEKLHATKVNQEQTIATLKTLEAQGEWERLHQMLPEIDTLIAQQVSLHPGAQVGAIDWQAFRAEVLREYTTGTGRVQPLLEQVKDALIVREYFKAGELAAEASQLAEKTKLHTYATQAAGIRQEINTRLTILDLSTKHEEISLEEIARTSQAPMEFVERIATSMIDAREVIGKYQIINKRFQFDVAQNQKGVDPNMVPFHAYEGDEPFLFVSYAHKDKVQVYPVIRRLNAEGYRIWYDEGIPASSDWPQQIATKIQNCTIFLVFISPIAVISQNVWNEINFAIGEKKRFVAIHLEETTLPGQYKLQMGVRQAIMKFTMSMDAFMNSLRHAPDMDLCKTTKSHNV